ncbi:MAG: hypothetical protein HOV66_09230, partial [Streptomycetaceae bacterium]|nr:hypothetical protein [Streptomycetaceae bacterium]
MDVAPPGHLLGARRVPDVGCGTGNPSARLRRTGVAAAGPEPDSATAAVAEQRLADDPGVVIVWAPFSFCGAARTKSDGTPHPAGRVL